MSCYPHHLKYLAVAPPPFDEDPYNDPPPPYPRDVVPPHPRDVASSLAAASPQTDRHLNAVHGGEHIPTAEDRADPPLSLHIGGVGTNHDLEAQGEALLSASPPHSSRDSETRLQNRPGVILLMLDFVLFVLTASPMISALVLLVLDIFMIVPEINDGTNDVGTLLAVRKFGIIAAAVHLACVAVAPAAKLLGRKLSRKTGVALRSAQPKFSATIWAFQMGSAILNLVVWKAWSWRRG